jgi:hypothetical protein
MIAAWTKRGAILFIFALALAGSFISGCGGGTAGTGGSGTFIEGRVLDVTGQPVVNAQITQIENGATAQTDNLGNFAFTSPVQGVNTTLLVESGGVSASTALEVGVEPTVQLAVILEFDSSAGVVEVIERSDTPDPVATPTPTASPAPPTPGPTPTPTTHTRFTGVLAAVPRSLIAMDKRARFQINSFLPRRISPADGTFDFTIPRSITELSATFYTGERAVTIELPSLPGTSVHVNPLRVRVDDINGELVAELKEMVVSPLQE